MHYNAVRAKELLRIGTGITEAEFRENQEQAIEHLIENRSRLLLIQKTGWGKSNVYFIAAKLLRESGGGPALLISPLLSLMRNQIYQAERMGVRAVRITSDNRESWEEVEEAIKGDETDSLLVSPERLENEHFLNNVLSVIAPKVSLLIVDEAHCISDWGHDFRPHYRLIDRIIRNLPGNIRLLATTATANNRVTADLETVLGPDITTLRGDLNRPSLYLQTISLPQPTDRLAWLASCLDKLPGSGIIYTLTKRDTRRVADWLKSKGFRVDWYDSEQENREELEKALIENRLKALVATTALGMGFDKPDIGFVIHYQTPGSVIAYYQQVGRAGRAIDAAYGILLIGQEEDEINDFFIESAFPTRQEVGMVLRALEEEPDGLSIHHLLRKLNISQGRLDKTLELLSLESPSPVVKQDSKWQLTVSPLGEDFWNRIERLTELRRSEKQQMKEYSKLEKGHMEYLIKALDGETGPIRTPDVPPMPVTPDPSLVLEAAAFLKRTSLPFEPRINWPAYGLPVLNVKGKIPTGYQAREGKILCTWGDSGWGTMVRQGKYTDGRYGDGLVEGCVSLMKEWNPQPKPAWVTCIPSLRHPELVPDFARRLAKALGLPFRQALEKISDRPGQKTMANSQQQARNVDGVFRIEPESILSEPVLLVDDMVDSRWTMTVAAYLLRLSGAGDVFPLALAYTGNK